MKDIVEDCGVNRKTFYYYFQDIYALTDELLSANLPKLHTLSDFLYERETITGEEFMDILRRS